jgi:hypothetical protein
MKDMLNQALNNADTTKKGDPVPGDCCTVPPPSDPPTT